MPWNKLQIWLKMSKARLPVKSNDLHVDVGKDLYRNLKFLTIAVSTVTETRF